MKPYLYIQKSVIDQTLATPAFQGVHFLEPFQSLTRASGMPLKILEEVNANGNAEMHENEADLFLCLEGTPTFLIQGDEIVLHPGEWLWIPAGVPHQHHSSGTSRIAIIKIPA